MIRRGALCLARHLLLCGLLVALATFAAGAALVARPPTTYTATTVFSLIPRPGAAVPAATMQFVAASYEARLMSAEVFGEVAARTGESSAEVAHATTVAVDPDTANLRIEVKLPSARRAVTVANLIAIQASDRVDPFVTVDFVSPAIDSSVVVNPPRRLLLVAVATVAAAVGISFSFVVAYRRPADIRPRSAEVW